MNEAANDRPMIEKNSLKFRFLFIRMTFPYCRAYISTFNKLDKDKRQHMCG